MPVYPVERVAKLISGKFSKPYLVRVSGSNMVYFGQDSSLAIGNQSVSLEPGGSMNWSGETELWVIGADSSEIELLFTGDTAVSPGPRSVGISALPQFIGRVVGNSFAAGATGAQALPMSNVDVSQYSSVLVKPRLTTNVNPLPINGSEYLQILIYQHDVPFTSGGIPDATAEAQWYAIPFVGNSQEYSFQIPVKYKYVSIDFVYIKLQTTSGGNLRFDLYGTKNVIPEPRYVSYDNSNLSGQINRGGMYARLQNGTGTSNELLNTVNGKAILGCVNSGAQGTNSRAEIAYYEKGQIKYFGGVAAPAIPGEITTRELILPYRPITIAVVSNAGAIITGVLMQ